MTRLAPALLCLLLGAPVGAAAAGGAASEVRDVAALDAVATSVATRVAALFPPATTRLALGVDARVRRLGSAAELALAAALRKAGFAPPLAARSAVEALAAGADALVTLRLEIAGGALVAAGEVRPVRSNFFTGAALSAGGALLAEAPADAAARLLAGRLATGPLEVEWARFATLPTAPLALAVGHLGGVPHVAAITRDELVLFDAAGAEVTRLVLEGTGVASRDPRAGVVVAGDRVRYALPLRGSAAVLRLERGRLIHEEAAPADVIPLAAGEAGVLAALQAPGGNLFGPMLLRARPASPAAPLAGTLENPFVAALAAPHAGATPFGVIDVDGTFVPLDAELTPHAPIRGIGDAAALADLDGDGTPELVASARTAAGPDVVRVIPPGGGRPVEAAPRDVPLLTAAAGDLGAGEVVVFGAADGTLHLLRRVTR
ncbi:hypothetical protein [Vulgatibacter sp.]|uniref:hypothetical protein n=1 Tax=Vulgatibacter sp. TaxID=1971226 RepID=UPI003565944A